MVAFLILLALLFIIVVGVELLARRLRLPLELSRKMTHILTGVAVALSAGYVTQEYRILLSVLFIIVIIVSKRRGIFTSIHDSERTGIGDIWYPVGIILAALLFADPLIFMYAILILAVSDGLAGLIGKFFGKRRIPHIGSPKTYLGTSVFAVTAFGLSLLVVSPLIAIGAALILTLIELFSRRGLDNLILPVVAGAIATLFILR